MYKNLQFYTWILPRHSTLYLMIFCSVTKIKIFGIGGKLLSLMYSYLNNRKQCVKIEDCSSTLKEVTSGVPQGSILGPLLFLLFVNDLPETMNDTDSFGYADDFKAILLNQTSLDTATLKIEKWLHENKMQPNIKKSTLLGIKGDLKASLLNKNLSSVNSQRDLGLIVSNKLTWNENSSRRTSKAISALFQVKRSLTMKSSVTTRLNAYTGYVLPIVTYASQAWTPSRCDIRPEWPKCSLCRIRYFSSKPSELAI